MLATYRHGFILLIERRFFRDFTYHPTEERVLVKKTYHSDGQLKETVYYVDENFVNFITSVVL